MNARSIIWEQKFELNFELRNFYLLANRDGDQLCRQVVLTECLLGRQIYNRNFV